MMDGELERDTDSERASETATVVDVRECWDQCGVKAGGCFDSQG
jgi:hypothetical protein